MVERFLALPEEKKERIIEAGLKVFGENGYKKGSVMDIAKEARISKAMIFHYFGSKKDFYLYLVEITGRKILKEMEKDFDEEEGDFFQRIRQSTYSKLRVVKRYPSTLTFFTSVFYEDDPEVKKEIQEKMKEGEQFRERLINNPVDLSRFKEDVDLKVFMRMFTWITEGYTVELSKKEGFDVDEETEEFEECLRMLEKFFYKGDDEK